jgi:hypothetical protein
VLHLWSWADLRKAIPYLHSIVGSLREHWLDVLNAQRKLDQSAERPGPVKRQHLLETESQTDDRDRAQVKFDEALDELNRLDVYLVDPVKGLALIPFRKEDDLAWYVFDHFEARGVIGWRYHADPMEECRPLDLLPETAGTEAAAIPND